MQPNALIRSILIGSTSLGLALALGVAATAQSGIGITVNGNPVNVSPAPIMQNGRVFVPLRGVFEDLGAGVDYNNGQINATGSNGTEISLQIGSTQASVNGSAVTVDVAPFIVGESTYVPLRFISQAMGATVNWDDSDQIVQISLAGAPDNSGYAESADYITTPPPPIPDYQPPPVPDPNDIWTPGYWAWGSAGYYWVPGTWVPAPQPGLLWTPGYWGWQSNGYHWRPGYWATQIGFYGGVNYGGGYYGHGYAGGRWANGAFQYNTAVVHVTNTTIIRNVYANSTVIVNNSNRVSYNGGPGGIAVRPSAGELAAGRTRHVAMTSLQQQHQQVAGQDRGMLATVNAGHPPVAAAPHPFTPAAKPAGFAPITPQDRTAAQRYVTPVHRSAPAAAHPPAVHPAAPAHPAYAAPPAQHPAAVAHPAQAQHPAAPAHPAYAPQPAQHPAAVAHPAQAQHPAAPAHPAYAPQPAQHPAAVAHPAQAQHPAAPAHPAYAPQPAQHPATVARPAQAQHPAAPAHPAYAPQPAQHPATVAHPAQAQHPAAPAHPAQPHYVPPAQPHPAAAQPAHAAPPHPHPTAQ